jgi:predicted N-acetyltransferase YhbS
MAHEGQSVKVEREWLPIWFSRRHEVYQSAPGSRRVTVLSFCRARPSEPADASCGFVVCEGRRVIGYYSLAAGSVFHETATGKVRRTIRDPVPITLLGRLTVDHDWQGRGLSRALLRDAPSARRPFPIAVIS